MVLHLLHNNRKYLLSTVLTWLINSWLFFGTRYRRNGRWGLVDEWLSANLRKGEMKIESWNYIGLIDCVSRIRNLYMHNQWDTRFFCSVFFNIFILAPYRQHIDPMHFILQTHSYLNIGLYFRKIECFEFTALISNFKLQF